MIDRRVPLEDLHHVLAWCGDDFRSLHRARILLTGGTGFFGTWLVEALLLANQHLDLQLEILLLTRDPQRFRDKAPGLCADPALRLLAGDVCQPPAVSGPVSHVIHAAAEASARLNAERPLEMIDTIVTGTRQMLRLAREAGARRFLFISSGAVYGRQPASLATVPEDYPGGPDPLHPAAAYAEAKRLAEQLCAIAGRTGGMDILIARCWAFIGPWLPLDAHFAAGNLIRDALSGGPLILTGDGTTVRSYLYSADLTAWLIRILVQGRALRPVNVGSDEAVSIGDLAHRIAGCCDGSPQVEIRGRPDPAKSIDRYVPQIRRAREELALDTWTSLQIALEKTIAWHRLAAKVSDRHQG